MQFHPTSCDLAEAARIFTTMDAMNLGAECFATGLMEVSPEFAQALAEQLERKLAMKNPVDNLDFTLEKTLAKSIG
jgi:hypothetical protein